MRNLWAAGSALTSACAHIRPRCTAGPEGGPGGRGAGVSGERRRLPSGWARSPPPPRRSLSCKYTCTHLFISLSLSFSLTSLLPFLLSPSLSLGCQVGSRLRPDSVRIARGRGRRSRAASATFRSPHPPFPARDGAIGGASRSPLPSRSPRSLPPPRQPRPDNAAPPRTPQPPAPAPGEPRGTHLSHVFLTSSPTAPRVPRALWESRCREAAREGRG